MNSAEMLRLVDSIARDRNLDKEVLLRDIEQALVSAARKHFNAADTEEFSAEVDQMSGQIRVYHEGEEIPLDELGRIPAQTAKQVMIQRFREDERTSIYHEFIDRVGELVTGMAQRYEGGALVISIGRAEGFMPRSEQIPGEQHQPGERVRCLILDVRDAGNQVKIVLSRASPEFIRRLFEVEVPEVSERIIEVKALAREPGHRTKIAVSSIDSKVDAVGACVGVRGSRIKNIVDELGGEKIDIVRWNESSQILIQNALKPAEIAEISLCFELGRATVVVNEDQLSLAIGKRGQNVRLAARLTNWDVDILTPAEFSKSLDTLENTLKTVDGIDEEQIDRLAALGVISVFDLEEVGAEYLAETLQVEQAKAQELVEIGSAKAKEVSEQQQREREEAERKKQEAEAAGEEVSLDDILGGGGGITRSASSADPDARTLPGGAVPSDESDSLGLGPAEGETAQPAGYRGESAPASDSGDIVDMLETQNAEQSEAGTTEPPSNQ
jgi:N utilization substance protein A